MTFSLKRRLEEVKQSNPVKIIVFVVSLTVAGVTGAFFEEIYYWWRSGPDFEPYVAVVVSKESIDFAIPEEFLRGFQDGASEGRTFIETRDGRKVDIRTLEDLGSVDEAARIAQQLVTDENCILVIGNSNSTLTARTLDIFLSSKNPPSYVLPIATANDLITKARTAGHKGVLRMVPDNASQAEIIQRLVADLSPSRRVAIYSDEENAVYSMDLSRDVASRVRNKGGRVVIEEMVGPTNSIFNSLPAWERGAPPDVIVYVGVAHHGLLLIDQLSELNIQVPVVFTDGCMVEPLIDNISRIPNRAFVLSPVGTPSGTSQMPTYRPIGRDAFTLVSKILSSCSDCTRENLRLHIAEHKDQIVVASGHAGEYRFNADGNNIGMSYKVYEVTGGKLRVVSTL